MRRNPTFWLVVSLLCFAGAFYFWRRGDLQREAEQKQSPVSVPPAAKPAFTNNLQPTSSSGLIPPAQPAASKATAKTRYPWRLTNTDKSASQMLRSPKAIHLMNALLDTSKPVSQAGIPDKLRVPKDNGSYIVQASGPVDNNFRALLQRAGATIVSYVPNNAYLVQVSAAGAQQLQASAQSVLPFEPYYKLDPSLLNSVMTDAALPAPTLKVTLFPGATASVLDALAVHPIATENSPFGLVVTVPAFPGIVEAMATMPAVQAIAPAYGKKIANDLARPRLNISADSLITTSNYLGLTGSNILVNINDTGADSTHPDLMGRLGADFTNNLADADGHGTHVTGTILGNGSKSLTVTNASGSVTNASFRGMATNATAYELSYFDSDSYLQEQAASSNAPISNNSWNYGDAEYDIASASYDAAVRDALPEVSGSQPLIFVFSAGNSGGGTEDGQNGSADSILSPATAKNVITVGAIEQDRNITNNYVTDTNGDLGQPFLNSSDTSNQVAWSSSRGNVGIGIEGPNGRFKPDLVAPGMFVISCRSQQWDTNSYYNPTNVVESYYANQSVAPGGVTTFVYPVPANPDQMIITVLSNSASPSPFPQLPIYVALNQVPSTNTDLLGSNQVFLPTNALGLSLNYGDTVYFSVGNPTNVTVNFDLEVQVLETNADPFYELALSNLNNSLSAGPPWYYRYESGTSMAAAGVSGMLACMEEFFNSTLKITNASPALMKALLINGARSLSSAGQPYDFQVASSINFQGWGLPSLPNSLPPELTNYATGGANTMPILFYDQSPTNVLATGQSATTTLQLTPTAASQALRVTLVWTDPPGNPNVGVKLVNNLDLIVSNIDTGDVYYGNDIPSGSIYNEIWNTNSPSPADVVNNVENVFLPPSTGTNFAIIINGASVNVNAVTLNTNNVVQDYALVISTGDAGGIASSPFTITQPTTTNALNNVSPVTTLIDGIPLLNQRIGANSQYAATTNGITNQWNFYVYTNTDALTNSSFTNVAFITFFPPNLGVPRMEASGEIDPSDTNATRSAGADVDLYVSTNPALTNLDTNVIATAFAQGTVSVNRNGNQVVVFTNSAPGQVYYIGVKAEDQQGAQYGFAGVASDVPFNQMNSNGDTVVTMHVLPATIPGGSASSPQYALIFGVTTLTTPIRNATVTETVTAQNFGDYIGTLSHNGVYVTLNNHTYFSNSLDTTETFIYDDSGENNTPGSRTSDHPGSLQSYFGTSGVGSWIFTMVNDSSPTDTGTINSFQITLQPQPPTTGTSLTLLGNAWYYDFIDVPNNCTNLTVSLAITTGSAPLELLIKYGGYPTLTDYDKEAIIYPPGGSISITPFDNPPLNPGRYYIAVYNPNNPSSSPVTSTLSESLGLSVTGSTGVQYLSVGNEPIPDDAVMDSTINVGVDTPVVSASVGVRINHPRISDLVLTLISPEGTRVLLAENRGGSSTNYGSGVNVTNVMPQTTSGTALTESNIVVLTNGTTAGTLVINYQFFTVPDDMRIYYNGTRIFDSGLINGSGTFDVNFGPGSTNLVIVMNEAGTNPNTNTTDLWNYTATVITESANYAVFTEDTNLTTLPIKFAVPPFAAGPAYTPPVTLMSSSFEGFTNGAYNSLDGWTTSDTNPVTVANVPALADSGTNVLALHQGTITRILPTVAGATYTLNFAAHGRPYLSPVAAPYMVSWWKGESNMQDTITASDNGGYWSGVGQDTYTNGLVGEAFIFAGPVAPGAVEVNDAPSLEFTDSMTAEAWIYPTNTSIGNNYSIITKFDIPGISPTFNDAYSLSIESTNGDGLMQISSDGFDTSGSVLTANPIPANQWTHIASTYDGTTLSIYVNGILQGANVPAPEGINQGTDALGIGGTFGGTPQNAGYPPSNPFAGLIDEATVYQNALSPLQLQDIYAAGSAGKVGPTDSPQVSATLNVVGAFSTNFTASDTWSNYSITFIAPSNNMVLTVGTPSADGMLLDSFTLVQAAQATSNNYFLPEEPLTKVTGETAKGAWQLEVLDNRAGPPSPDPAPLLVSWELTLLTQTTTATAIPLTFGIAQTNSVPPGFISYYVVNVPPWAQVATNILYNVSGPVNLLFNQNYEPGATTNGGDVLLLGNTTGGITNIATSNTPVVLLPGQQYYLGVQNTGSATVTFSIEVTFNIPVLTNMVPVTNSLAASSIPQYYQFNVTNGGWAAAFQLLNLTGNLSLVASYGPPLPTLAANAYSASYFGSNETILVFSNTSPVPLTAGTWYLGVYNNDITTQNYTIMASEYGQPNIIPLSNGVPFTTNFPPGPSLNTFFSFTIADNPNSALFELYNLNGNVDLTVDRGAGNYPYQPPYFAGSFNPGTNDEQILVRTNPVLSGIITTNLNDTWYFGVPNNQTYNVTFTILAQETTNGILTNGYPTTLGIQNSTNGLTFTWPTVPGQTYEIQYATNIFPPVVWTPLVTNTNAPPNIDTYFYSNTNTNFAGPFIFFRLLQLPTF